MSSHKSSSRRSTSTSNSKSDDPPKEAVDLSFSRWILGGRLIAPAGQKIAIRRRDSSGRVDRVVEIPHGKDLKDRREREKKSRERKKIAPEECAEEKGKDHKEIEQCCDTCKAFWKEKADAAEAASAQLKQEEEKKGEAKDDKEKPSACEGCLADKAEKEKSSETNKADDAKTENSNTVGESSTAEKNKKPEDKPRTDTNGFTSEDDAKIIEMKNRGQNHKSIAAELKRTPKDVGKRVYELNKAGAFSKKDEKNDEAVETPAVEVTAEAQKETENSAGNDSWGASTGWGDGDFAAIGGSADETNGVNTADVNQTTSQAGGKTEKETESDWNPPQDAWAIPTSAEGWPAINNNDPDNTLISSVGNGISANGSDWGTFDINAHLQAAQSANGNIEDIPNNNTSKSEAMMSGANGDGKDATIEVEPEIPSIPQTDFSKLFASGAFTVNNSSKSIFGEDVPTEYFTSTYKTNASVPTDHVGGGKKVHFDESNISNTSNATTNIQENQPTNSSDEGWGSSADKFSKVTGATKVDNDVVSGAMPGAWDAGFGSAANSSETTSSGDVTGNNTDAWGSGHTVESQNATTNTEFTAWGAPPDHSNGFSNMTSSNTANNMPGAWDQSGETNTRHSSSTSTGDTKSFSQHPVQQNKTSFPPSQPSPNRFESSLKPAGVFSPDDVKWLSFFAHRYEEDKWLQMQCKLLNTTGHSIPAEIIEKKFREDGLGFCGK